MTMQKIVDGVYVPLTPEEIAKFEATPVPSAVEEWRKHAVLTRREFCIGCYRSGLLTATVAEVAAAGGWPDEFVTALDWLDETQQAEARIEWPAVTEVRRLAPILLLLQFDAGISDETLDAMFGWDAT